MTEPIKRKSSMSEFRKHNRRIDYFPVPDALSAIEQLRKLHPDAPMRAIIDMLVVAGIKALAPKASS